MEKETDILSFYDSEDHNVRVFAGLETVINLLMARVRIIDDVLKNYDPVRSRTARENHINKMNKTYFRNNPIPMPRKLSEVEDWNLEAEINSKLLALIDKRILEIKELQSHFVYEACPTEEQLQEAAGVLVAGMIQSHDTYVKSNEHSLGECFQSLRDALGPLTNYGSVYPFDYDMEFAEPPDDDS